MECMKDDFRTDQLLGGRFRTIAPLNHGSFGMVFLAEDTLTRQHVAIKCLTKPSLANQSVTQSADEGEEELACHAILKHHDHLVNLVHHFQTEAHSYLVLEYCSQGDLYEAIRLDRGPVQTEHVRRFMLQLISAVQHMHANGLYHRDIKPENIFLTQDGSVKLGDFGLATKSLWSYESCVGSDRYMAPEQYDPAGMGYSPAQADIWSLGICLLNVLFARNPFVTPTESDVLFADYRRDRQSLFDIFPNMSQDTFEILSVAMAVDPAKRDLAAVKQAVIRAVAFTTEDESFDDLFCAEDRDVVRASANREPLRTPSIQSPQLDGDSFPWAKALHASPAPKQQLASIPDAYEEDLFASDKSLKLGESWYSGSGNTPSLASVLDSAYGSFKSLAIKRRALSRPDPVPIPSSLPSRPSRPIPTMSSVFGKKGVDTVAKSWSDMFEEDEEESEREADMKFRRQHNARSWSQDSQKRLPVPPGVLAESKSRSSSNARRSRTPKPTSPVKTSFGVNENDPFVWRARTPRHSPPQVPADKWAALGNKRRNFQIEPDTRALATKKRAMTTGSRKRPTSGIGYEHHHNTLHRRDSRGKARPAYLNQDWRQQRAIDSSGDEDDLEWVGGWHNFHL
ncbi:cAMP-dependent protein kinase catalytic subunit [Cladophialophora chaetospira]|uniref:cAMP-dependent protein kinase catalytic subunit n=1 Tax=Cladophialophora chaetospira TaxID=386627 RepID=A0AA39CD01_9EURO|nr:cAMP-dependent protein kinase catalytic subunit [Cladophialophora chaetospira]